MAVAADYDNDQAYLKNIREELRFAIYRGYIKYDPDSVTTGNTYYPYPIATPEPISSGKNNMSLLYWGDRKSVRQISPELGRNNVADLFRNGVSTGKQTDIPE